MSDNNINNTNNINTLILSGGGIIGFTFLGILKELHQHNVWELNNIKHIYSTSAGSIIALLICLDIDWNTLTSYIVSNPWDNILRPSAKQILNSFSQKGLYDKTVMEHIFDRLFAMKSLNINTTLFEFYQLNNINLNIFSFDINTFTTVVLNYQTYPNMTLIDAVTISCSLPGLFKPNIIDDKCLIDGGVLSNYPINECLENLSKEGLNENNVLGLKLCYDSELQENRNVIITENTNLLDYIMGVTLNSINYITNTIKEKEIKNTIKCCLDKSPMTMNSMKECLQNKEKRIQLIENGIKIAKEFVKAKVL